MNRRIMARLALVPGVRASSIVVNCRKHTISVAARAMMITLFALFMAGLGGQTIAADLSQAISVDERITLFARAAIKAGLNEILKEPGPFVAFIPSDQAMVNEGSAFLLNSVLLTAPNAGRLADLVRHHVVRASRQTMELADVVELQTLADVPLDVVRVGTGLMVARQAAVSGRIVADNGVVYIVDRLLWPRDSQWASGTNDVGQPRHFGRAPAVGGR